MNTVERHLPVLDSCEAASTVAASRLRPFVGLRPFDFEDHEFFFGRGAQVAVLELSLERDRLLSVIGNSGSGKSSLVQAGLLPKLQSGAEGHRWTWVVMRPGEAPIARLAEALSALGTGSGAPDRLTEARTDRLDLILRESSYGISSALKHLNVRRDMRRLIILIDQFEEIFRFADMRAQLSVELERGQERRDDATLFVQLLLAARDDPEFNGHIVLTMRSDFIGDCGRFHGLSEAVTATQYLVPSLTRDQRAEAIRGPVRLAGAEIEPRLVQRLLNDTNEDADQLPVMQHALMRCWQHAVARGGGKSDVRVEHEDYVAIGGLEGALSNHATEIMAELAGHPIPALKALGYSSDNIVKRVFQCLTDIDSRGRVTRRPQTLGNVVSILTPDGATAEERAAIREEVRSVVERFSSTDSSFLRSLQGQMLAEDSVLDIGHEALIRRWDKLGAPNELNWVREEQLDCERLSDLARISKFEGTVPPQRLPEFESWWRTRRPNRAWALRYSPDGAEMLRMATEVIERSRKEIELRRNRRTAQLRAIWTATASAIVLLLIITVLALRLGAQSKLAAQRASESWQALLSFVGRYQLTHSSAHRALLTALYGLNSTETPVRELKSLAYAALEQMREVRILHINVTADSKGPVFMAIAFDPKDRLLIAAKRTLFAWDTAGGKLVEIARLAGDATDMALSADGRTALIGVQLEDGQRAEILGLGSQAPTPHSLDPDHQVLPGAGILSRDGRYVVTPGTWTNEPPRLWRRDDEGYALVPSNFAQIKGLQKGASGAAFSADSSKLALVSRSGDLHLFRVTAAGVASGETRPLPSAVQQASGFVTTVAFDPREEADRVLIVRFGSAYLLDLGTNKMTPIPYSNGSVRGMFSPDGKYVALSDMRGVVRLYDFESNDAVVKQQEVLSSGGVGWTTIAWSHSTPYKLATTILSEASSDSVGATESSVWLWDFQSALSRGLTATERLAASSTSDDGRALPVSAGGVTVSVDGQTRSFKVTSNRSDVTGGTLSLPKGTPPPRTAALSGAGEWLAWSLNDERQGQGEGGILLFHLTESLSPIAEIGEGSSWTAIRFSSNASEDLMAVDASGHVSSWRYFGSTDHLAGFINKTLPKESVAVALSDLLPGKEVSPDWSVVQLSAADCRNLLGVVNWITGEKNVDRCIRRQFVRSEATHH